MSTSATSDPNGASPAVPGKTWTLPVEGEVIHTERTKNTFTIGKKIGEGAFGVVFECRDVWNNELAAKVLKGLASYEQVKAKASAEFERLFRLRNPFITHVYDAFEYRNTFYIITERCHFSIVDLLNLDKLHGQDWLLPIARSIVQAVNYLHMNDYVHQDIHPGNVFAAVVKDEVLPAMHEALKFKLGDLGVARLIGEVSVANTRAQWMNPPEVLNPGEFGKVDHRVDIYHLGLLLLQLAVSKPLTFTVEEILAGKPREMALQLPAPFNFALEKALRRHVDYRTNGAMELWRDLQSPGSAAPRGEDKAVGGEGESK